MNQNKWFPLYTTSFVIMFTFLILMLIDRDLTIKWINDKGFIQQLNVHVLSGATFLCFFNVVYSKSARLAWFEATIVLLIYTLREMDLHRLYAEEHITKWKFYVGPDPLSSKLMGGAILLVFLAAFVHLGFTHLSLALQEFKAKKAWPIIIVVWAALLLFSQIMDKVIFIKMLWVPALEESIELGAAYLMFSIIWLLSHGVIVALKQE